VRSLLLRLYGAFTKLAQPLVRRKLRRRASGWASLVNAP
jgi:3-deoxy-D-manno-octulosonic-acid transferase